MRAVAMMRKRVTDATKPFRLGLRKRSSAAGEFKLGGTAFEFLLNDSKVWWCLAWLALWMILSRTGVVDPIDQMPDAISSSSSKQLTYYVAIVSFVLGFFSLQTYRSYQDQGRCATSLGGKIYEFLFMVKVGMKEYPDVQRKVVRLVCAFSLLFWMDMSNVYSYEHLQRMGLLRPEEVDALTRMPGKKSLHCMLWALDALHVHFQSLKRAGAGPGQQMEDTFVYHSNFLQLQSKLFDIRTKFAELQTMREIDVPIVYSHCLWWLIVMFLTITGYFAGIGSDNNSSDQLWVLGYFALMIAYLGLFDIALALKEPFGEDSVDLDPFYFINGCLKNCRTFMTSDIPTNKAADGGSSDGGASLPSVDFFTSTLPIDIAENDSKAQFMFADDDLAHLMQLKLAHFAELGVQADKHHQHQQQQQQQEQGQETWPLGSSGADDTLHLDDPSNYASAVV